MRYDYRHDHRRLRFRFWDIITPILFAAGWIAISLIAHYGEQIDAFFNRILSTN